MCRIDDNRPVKALLHSELSKESRRDRGAFQRFKDTCKNASQCSHVLNLWKTTVDRQECRKLIHISVKVIVT